MGQIVYELIGTPGVWGYVILHAVAGAVVLGLLAWWLVVVSPTGAGPLSVRLVILSPMAALLIVFLGAYDPFTVLGMVGLIYSWTRGPRWLSFVAGLYLGFQHFEQGLVAIVVGGMVAWAVSVQDPTLVQRHHIPWAVPGLIVGKLALILTLWLTIEDGIGGRSSFVVWEWVRPAIVSQANFGPVILLSAFSGAWAIVAFAFLRTRRQGRLWLAIAFAVCLIPTSIAADHTRIFILCSFVGLSFLTAAFLRDPAFSRRDRQVVEWMAWVITPLFIWTAGEGFGYVQHTGVLDLFIMLGQQVSAW